MMVFNALEILLSLNSNARLRRGGSLDIEEDATSRGERQVPLYTCICTFWRSSSVLDGNSSQYQLPAAPRLQLS